MEEFGGVKNFVIQPWNLGALFHSSILKAFPEALVNQMESLDSLVKYQKSAIGFFSTPMISIRGWENQPKSGLGFIGHHYKGFPSFEVG